MISDQGQKSVQERLVADFTKKAILSRGMRTHDQCLGSKECTGEADRRAHVLPLEVCGYMISASGQKSVQERLIAGLTNKSLHLRSMRTHDQYFGAEGCTGELIAELMSYPNQVYPCCQYDYE